MESPWKRRRCRTPRTQKNHVAVAYEKTRDSAAICLKMLLDALSFSHGADPDIEYSTWSNGAPEELPL